MLCVEYPQEILNGILNLMDKREEENVEFDEFLCGIRTILMYDNFFEEMENFFKHLDFEKTGKIVVEELRDAVRKLRSEEVLETHELRIPPIEDIESALASMTLET